jgi:hypothetical protein
MFFLLQGSGPGCDSCITWKMEDPRTTRRLAVSSISVAASPFEQFYSIITPSASHICVGNYQFSVCNICNKLVVTYETTGHASLHAVCVCICVFRVNLYVYAFAISLLWNY